MSLAPEPFLAAARRFVAAPGATPAAHTAALRPLRDLLQAVDPGAIDLASAQRAAPAAGWQATSLIEAPEVHLSLFVLRAGQSIPLHDHPGLHGLLRVLRGQVRVEAWDWEPPRTGAPARGASARARARGAQTVTRDGLALTLPGWCSLHRLEAVEDTALLDLFAPYYDAAAGRTCSYYRAQPLGDGAWSLTRL